MTDIDLVISVAHGRNTSQAKHGLFNEYTLSLMYSTMLIEMMAYENNLISHKLINQPLWIPKRNAINEINPKLAIEIHFNSSNDGKARGCETLHYPNSVKGVAYATIIQDCIQYATRHPNRGIKPGWYRGEEGKPLYFLKYLKCPSLIIEPYFIQSDEEIITNAPVMIGFLIEALNRIL